MFDTAGRSGAQFASWIAQATAVRPGDEGARPVLEDVLPGPTEERWMSSIAQRPPSRRPVWQRLIGFNLLTAIVLAIVGWLFGHLDRQRDSCPEPRLHRRHRAERHLDPARLPVRGDRLPDRPGVRQLPDPAADGAPAEPRRARGRGGGDRALLPALHRPQGRRDPVHRRHRCVLLRRRAQRDAHPHRAAAAEHARLRRQPVPHAGRHARGDDDGDDDLRRSSARSPTGWCR